MKEFTIKKTITFAEGKDFLKLCAYYTLLLRLAGEDTNK